MTEWRVTWERFDGTSWVAVVEDLADAADARLAYEDLAWSARSWQAASPAARRRAGDLIAAAGMPNRALRALIPVRTVALLRRAPGEWRTVASQEG